ncbi:MAG: MFS transporter [Proteocatella sp.]
MWNVVVLGFISFFSDISAEMIYPIIPLYLTSVFGATPALIGLIEGIAESLASLLRVYSGYITDKYRKKKSIAFLGYSAGVVYKLALILASTWTGVLLARVIDRVGKGIRTAPRDVMVSEGADENHMGKAFGIHKALDMAGSAIGILIAYFLLKNSNETFDYKKLFLISIIPAIMGLMMFVMVKEKQHENVIGESIPFWKNVKKLDKRLKLYLLVTFLFTLGNSSNAFLILRAKSVGFEDTSVILLYFIYNVTASILAIPLGRISDKVGRKRVLLGGYIVFAAVYIGFAFAFNKLFMIIIFGLYGVYTAMITGVERAFIAEVSPRELKGTMLGFHATIVGIALLPASIIAGVLWNVFGPEATFLFGASMSVIAVLCLAIGFNSKAAED